MTLAERLREAARWNPTYSDAMMEGIDRLERYEAALREIIGLLEPMQDISERSRDAVDVARATLEEQKEN